jgi:hypothetical protein
MGVHETERLSESAAKAISKNLISERFGEQGSSA